jgi:putative ABC transport system permease protein
MFKNYMKSTIRILSKQKSYAFISVFSLVVGMACFILLMLFSKYELGYDSFHKNSGRIYQVGQIVPDWNVAGFNRFSSTSGALAPALKQEFPEVEYAVRIKDTDAPLVYLQNSVLGQGLYADQDFFNMFSYPLTSGYSQTALKDPFSIVLSESLGGKLFGRDDPIGKVVVHQNGREYQVTGIMKDAPRNSHLRFDYLLSFVTMSSLRNDVETSWSILNYFSYVQLKDGVAAKDFEAKLKSVVDKYHEPRNKKRSYFLMPLRSLHLETGVYFSYSRPVDKKYIYLLMGIACLVLIIACVNYVNLATARATVRSKEVGIRKTFGADRRHLFRQFMGESYLLTLASLVLSLILARFLLPVFNRLTGVVLPGRVLTEGTTVMGILALGLVVGFLSGSYPSLVLSALQPANVFKNAFGSKQAGRRLVFRNVLVVFQFFVTIVLIVGALVIQKQLNYIKRSDIGYQRENILVLRLWDLESRAQHQIIKKDLLKNPNILAAAVSNVAPVRMTEANNFRVETESGEMVDLPQVTNYFIDFDYFDLFAMKIVEGRKFSPDFLGDIENEVVLNESAIRMAGLKNPIGKILVRGKQRMRIIGVVKDIHFMSFKSKIGPLMFLYRPANINLLFLKISGHNVKETIASVNATIRKQCPAFVYDYAYMDDIYNVLYESENRLAGLLTGFSIIAILLASVGLFGLISFIVERKKKEIGIRKILGASVFGISGLLLRDLFVLIGVAGLISLPVAYFFSQKWLQGFFYRTNLSAGVFILATVVVLLIALLCIARLTIRAAKENPAVSLKNI